MGRVLSLGSRVQGLPSTKVRLRVLDLGFTCRDVGFRV